jgi:D-serine deaminase-like pyridoxal phosphate-dependent protein
MVAERLQAATARLAPPFAVVDLDALDSNAVSMITRGHGLPNRPRSGDQVWFRHGKAGELCERFDRLHLVQGDQIVDGVQTYRGEGRNFG